MIHQLYEQLFRVSLSVENSDTKIMTTIGYEFRMQIMFTCETFQCTLIRVNWIKWCCRLGKILQNCWMLQQKCKFRRIKMRHISAAGRPDTHRWSAGWLTFTAHTTCPTHTRMFSHNLTVQRQSWLTYDQSNHHNGISDDWLMFWLSVSCVTRCCLVPEKTRQQNLPEASAIKCHQNTVGGLDNFAYVLELKTAEATFSWHFNFRWVVICETCLPVMNTWEILH